MEYLLCEKQYIKLSTLLNETKCIRQKWVPQSVGQNMLNVHGQVSMGQHSLGSQDQAFIFRAYGDGSYGSKMFSN